MVAVTPNVVNLSKFVPYSESQNGSPETGMGLRWSRRSGTSHPPARTTNPPRDLRHDFQDRP